MTMNCAEFEAAVAAEPGSDSQDVAAHAAACESCRALREEYRELDVRIARALAVPLPDFDIPELPAMGETGNVVELRRRRAAAPVWFGLAATVALAAWLGLAIQPENSVQPSLAEQVVAHLDHEPYAMVISDFAVSERTLRSVVSNDVAELDSGIGLISYARSCVINGKTVPHLVVQGENGPITLLLMPDERVESAIPLTGSTVNGIILPVGSGSIAIIATEGVSLETVEKNVIDSVRWTT